MTSSRHLRAWFAVAIAAAAMLSACGGGDDGDGGSDGGSTTATTTTTETTPAAKPAGLVVGIGEQQVPMFSDPRFRALGVKHARLVIAYDAVAVDFERGLADAWLAAARAAGVEPFITFGHSRVRPKKLPTVAEFRAAFRAFRARYPQVRVYAPWNEINHSSQPTAKSPARAADYYNVVQKECDGCTVLAGDVLDQAGMVRYVKRYQRQLDGSPRIWGLHNYADANRFRETGLRDLMAAVPGDIWLTETGGLVNFGRAFPYDEKRAARAVTFALALARRSERVKRTYLYNWTGAKRNARFDSGLVGPDGRPRPGYEALKNSIDKG